MSCVRTRFFSRTGQDISRVGDDMLTSRTKRVRRNKTTRRKKTWPPGFEPTTSGHVADMSPTFPTKITKQLHAAVVSLDEVGALPDETYGDIF